MKEMNKDEQMNFFKETLLKTEREGMEDLLDFMDDLGFYTAPASGETTSAKMAVCLNIQ